MNLIKLAKYFESKLADVELKKYRKKLDNDKLESLVDKALSEYKNKDIDLSYNNQHYAWFVWDSTDNKHVQKDMNDFKADDRIKDVRDFVDNLKKIKLEDYE